jgi:hypothetical protein
MRTALLGLIFTFFSYVSVSAQPTTSLSTAQNTNNVQFTIVNPITVANVPPSSFTLFGDGKFTMNPTPSHDYRSIATYEPEVYSVKAYDLTDVLKLVDPTNPPGSININSISSNNNPPPPFIRTGRNIRTGQSWRAAEDNEWIYIISFRHPGGSLSGNANGSIRFSLDPNIEYVRVIEPQGDNANWAVVDNQPGYGQSGDISWDFSNLNTTEIRNLYVRVGLPPNMYGSRLLSDLSITWRDNQSNEEQEMQQVASDVFRYAHDPNKIIVHTPCLLGDEPAMQKLRYTVHFQNIGSYYANTVQVEVNPHWTFDVGSLTVINSSDPMSNVEVDPFTGKFYFTFPNINLPGTQQTFPINYSYTPDQTTGYVTFEICVSEMIPVSEPIDIDADIYFDQLAPINTGVTTIHASDHCVEIPYCDLDMAGYQVVNPKVETSQMKMAPVVNIYPNPVGEQLNLSFNMTDATGGVVQIELYNFSGQIQKTIFEGFKNNGTHSLDIDVSDLPVGTYLVKMQIGNHNTTERFIKLE